MGMLIVGYLIHQAHFVIVPEIQRNISLILPRIPILFFLPALFLFFVKSSFNPDFKISNSQKLFLVPGLIDVGYQIATWSYVQFHKTGSIYAFITGRGGHFTYEGIAILFSMYCFYHVIIDVYRSGLQKTESYYFFRFVIAGLAVILVRWIIMYFVDLFAPGSYDFTLQYYFWLFDSGFLLYAGYKMLTAPKVLKTDSSGVALGGRNELDHYANRLEDLLTEKKLYLKADLTRKDLAQELSLTEVQVSFIINEGLHSSYYELINRHRVEEATRLIRAGRLDQITVKALAQEAGFNSKSTFYKAFKEYIGTTPTRYMDSVSSA